jgi:hypothetical protein
LPARYRDPSRDVGNLEPGATLFRPEPVEVIPMRIIGDYQAELDRIRAHNFAHAYAAPPFRSAPYRTRSLRRS